MKLISEVFFLIRLQSPSLKATFKSSSKWVFSTSDLVNHIVPLVLDRLTSLGISNIASYRAIGNCESAFGDVRIKIEDPTLNLNISESIACSTSGSYLNTFRADLDIARSLAGPITIQLAQGPQDDLGLRTASLNYTLTASASPLIVY